MQVFATTQKELIISYFRNVLGNDPARLVIIGLNMRLVHGSVVALQRTNRVMAIIFGITIHRLIHGFRLRPLAHEILLGNSIPVVRGEG